MDEDEDEDDEDDDDDDDDDGVEDAKEVECCWGDRAGEVT